MTQQQMTDLADGILLSLFDSARLLLGDLRDRERQAAKLNEDVAFRIRSAIENTEAASRDILRAESLARGACVPTTTDPTPDVGRQ